MHQAKANDELFPIIIESLTEWDEKMQKECATNFIRCIKQDLFSDRNNFKIITKSIHIVNEALIDRFVATVDNLPRKQVSEKIRPAGRLATKFSAAAMADDTSFVLGPENFKRYDALVDLLATADVDALVALYRRYYPLFQESYERLGYPHDYFNDRVVEVIDHLLLTPEPRETVQLTRPHVLFEFADPQLEALSSGQKLLLRMGNEHASRVKQVLEALRPRLVSQ